MVKQRTDKTRMLENTYRACADRPEPTQNYYCACVQSFVSHEYLNSPYMVILGQAVT